MLNISFVPEYRLLSVKVRDEWNGNLELDICNSLHNIYITKYYPLTVPNIRLCTRTVK